MDTLPFEGIRVTDFGWVLAAPHCTQWLAVYGAEVIKIETHRRLDAMRTSPHGGFVESISGINRNGAFNSLNYGKRSCCLDMTTSEGKELMRRLVGISDIVVESFTSPVAEQFGLTYDELRAVKPDVILLSVSALGRTGPLKDVPGFGPNTQIFAGQPSITGYPGGPPTPVGGTWPDYTCGMAMVFPLLAALHHRMDTGQGQHIDFGMGEVVTAMIPEALLDYAMNGRVAGPQGNRENHMAPNNTYPCQGDDRWVAISVATDQEWRALCQVTGHPEWLDDVRFAEPLGRWKNQESLDALLAEWTRRHTPAEAARKLREAGVPAGPSADTLDLISDPQLQHRGLFREFDHPEAGRRLGMGMEGRFSAITEWRYTPAPLLDQDSPYVFQELLGLSSREMEGLVNQRVIH